MITRQRHKSFFRRLWLPVVALGTLAYFGAHAFTGAFGIWAMDRLEADGARLTAEHNRLVAERTNLETRVDMLRPPKLDADTIDQEARRSLNLMRPDEVVIALGAPQQSPQ
jgi:cell division protein FtsB